MKASMITESQKLSRLARQASFFNDETIESTTNYGSDEDETTWSFRKIDKVSLEIAKLVESATKLSSALEMFFISLAIIIAISYIYLIFLRKATAITFWISNIILILFVTLLGGFMIVDNLCAHGIIIISFGVVLTAIFLWNRRKICSAADLIMESLKMVDVLPQIKYLPILTILIFTITFVLTYSLTLYLLRQSSTSMIRYILYVLFIWMTLFLLNCQHFIVAGTISKWYFEKDKTKLVQPIKTTVFSLWKIHLKNVVFGTTLKILAVTVGFLKYTSKLNELVCSENRSTQIVNFIKNVSSKAYVIVAKDATSFYESGKKASELVSKRIPKVVGLIFYGNFELFICKTFIAILGVICSFSLCIILMRIRNVLLEDKVLIFFALFFVVYYILAFIEMTVDAILVCYCIDCEENGENSSISHDLVKVLKGIEEQDGELIDISLKKWKR